MRFLFANFGWKLLALAAAIVIWISVASEPELSTFISVPVQYKNIPDDMEISSDVPETVTLELRGPSGELRHVPESGPAVILDMSTVQHAGERTFPVAANNIKLPRTVRLVRAIPSELRFSFEHRQSKTVPVEVRFTNGPQPGYEVVEYVVVPQTMSIVGPDSRISKVENVVTDPIDLHSVVGRAEFHVNTFVKDARIRIESNPAVVVKVTVRSTAQQNGQTPVRN
jgi:YbbR domain-containing protein